MTGPGMAWATVRVTSVPTARMVPTFLDWAVTSSLGTVELYFCFLATAKPFAFKASFASANCIPTTLGICRMGVWVAVTEGGVGMGDSEGNPADALEQPAPT